MWRLVLDDLISIASAAKRGKMSKQNINLYFINITILYKELYYNYL